MINNVERSVMEKLSVVLLYFDTETSYSVDDVQKSIDKNHQDFIPGYLNHLQTMTM